VNEPLGSRFADALAYVVDLHSEQRRKGTDVPYVAHLLAVAGLAIEDAAATGELREDEAIAALLHDTAEDQGGETRLADITERFGPRVAAIVRACSDSLEDDGDKAPWRERKEAYLAHLAAEADGGVLRVSLADKVNNARAVLADYRVLGEPFWERFNRDADTPWYYRRLAEIFSERLPHSPLTAELVEAVGDLEAEIAANRAARPGPL
jgi:(p)ppGpp synthase/HD superfamily hydrolase